MKEEFDKVIREFIDFVNMQTGVYMDALAGFQGHKTKIERQIHRFQRPTKSSISQKGIPEIVWSSYEDPSKPDVIHNRIIRVNDYIEANSPEGTNYQQHSQAIIVFLFTYWEDEIRPRLANANESNLSDIKSDIMGDLRILRNVILHSNGIMRKDKFRSLKKTQGIFPVDQPITISYEEMHQIFVFIKQDCTRLLFDWFGVDNPPFDPESIKDMWTQFKEQNPT